MYILEITATFSVSLYIFLFLSSANISMEMQKTQIAKTVLENKN